MTSVDPEARDPGLAAERTDLAWDRSGLALLACGAAILRGVARPGLSAGDVAAGIAVLVLGVAVSALGWWHGHRRRVKGPAPTTPGDLLPIAVGVAVIGVAAFGLALVSG